MLLSRCHLICPKCKVLTLLTHSRRRIWLCSNNGVLMVSVLGWCIYDLIIGGQVLNHKRILTTIPTLLRCLSWSIQLVRNMGYIRCWISIKICCLKNIVVMVYQLGWLISLGGIVASRCLCNRLSSLMHRGYQVGQTAIKKHLDCITLVLMLDECLISCTMYHRRLTKYL